VEEKYLIQIDEKCSIRKEKCRFGKSIEVDKEGEKGGVLVVNRGGRQPSKKKKKTIRPPIKSREQSKKKKREGHGGSLEGT